MQLKRSWLVSGLGSDHLPLLVDFGIATPRSPEPVSVAPAPKGHENQVIEALQRLEMRLSQLEQVPQGAEPSDLRLYLMSSSLASMLVAAAAVWRGRT